MAPSSSLLASSFSAFSFALEPRTTVGRTGPPQQFLSSRERCAALLQTSFALAPAVSLHVFSFFDPCRCALRRACDPSLPISGHRLKFFEHRVAERCRVVGNADARGL